MFRQRNNHIDSILLKGVVASIYKSEDGYCWAGLRIGLVKIHPDFKQITLFKEFDGYIVRSIAGDGNGRILTGTNHGLFLQSEKVWKHIDRLNGLPDDYVNAVFFDRKNNSHWIGTNAGVCLLQYGRKVINFNDPLAKLRCNAFACDRQNNVWIATTAGLVKYAHGIFSLFNEKDRMPSDIYKLCYNEEEDKLYMLSPNQLLEIDVAQFL
ncbi:hypothetical protein [Niastella vici]|uniref:hypothetical protein n=1 Tax=Niastella vici TaxID=1703345 RepID=UPI00118170E6|nr:hypothetical protein [Niastella vici]